MKVDKLKNFTNSISDLQDLKKNLENEIEIMKILKGHENIVEYEDDFEEEDSYKIVMEDCKEGDLNSLLEKMSKNDEFFTSK